MFMKILLDKIMYERKLTVRQVANKTKLTKSTIYRIMKGETSPTINELEILAKGLELTIFDFMEPYYQKSVPNLGQMQDFPTVFDPSCVFNSRRAVRMEEEKKKKEKLHKLIDRLNMKQLNRLEQLIRGIFGKVI